MEALYFCDWSYKLFIENTMHVLMVVCDMNTCQQKALEL